MKLIGVIVRRRVLGKHLAFCHVQKIQRHQQDTSTTKLQEARDGELLLRLTRSGKEYQETDNQTEQEEEGQEEGQGEQGNGGGDDNNIIRVAFRRSSEAWDATRDETFPTKVSRLPYGATVRMELLPSPPKQEQQQQQQQEQERRQQQQQQQQPSYDWEVCRWQILVHPYTAAQATSAVDMHQNNNSDSSSRSSSKKDIIVSVPAYLRARGKVYMELHPEKRPKKIKVPKPQRHQGLLSTDKTMTPDEDCSITSINPHGDAQAKCQRASVFCQWLLATFGEEIIQRSSSTSSDSGNHCNSCTTVLDVASGKGQLSIELACSPGGGVRCIMVDPMIRGQRHDPTIAAATNRQAAKSVHYNDNHYGDGDDYDSSLQILGKRARKRILKAGGTVPTFLPAFFDATSFVQEHATMLQKEVALFVGLHPDQCTEAIVDVALRLRKSFAVVPCCVFGDLFSVRMLRQSTTTGDQPAVPVRTYEQFLQYLRQKDPRIQQATLPVCGKNQVLYLHQ